MVEMILTVKRNGACSLPLNQMMRYCTSFFAPLKKLNSSQFWQNHQNKTSQLLPLSSDSTQTNHRTHNGIPCSVLIASKCENLDFRKYGSNKLKFLPIYPVWSQFQVTQKGQDIVETPDKMPEVSKASQGIISSRPKISPYLVLTT